MMTFLPRPLVSSLMSEAVVMVDPADRLRSAELLMRLVSSRHIPVVASGRLVGIISARDVLRSRAGGDEWLRAGDVMSRPVRVVGPYDEIAGAARRMLQQRVSSLPVVDDQGALVGMVTSTDLVRDAVRELREVGGVGPDRPCVSALMTAAPLETIELREPIDLARLLMRERACRHLPVMAGGELRGVISDRDLLAVSGAAVGRPVVAGEIMSAPVHTTAPEDAADAAGDLLLARRIGCLPVVSKRALVGIITEVDFIRWRADRLRF
jgi:CBS domain-containing protein